MISPEAATQAHFIPTKICPLYEHVSRASWATLEPEHLNSPFQHLLQPYFYQFVFSSYCVYIN